VNGPSTAQSVTALLKLLNADRQDYQQLITQLEQQRQLMLRRRGAALLELNAALTAVYQRLSAHAVLRHQYFIALEIPASSAGFDMLVKRLPPSHHLALNSLWRQLADAALTCKRLNERNGALLTLQRDLLAPWFDREQDYIYKE